MANESFKPKPYTPEQIAEIESHRMTSMQKLRKEGASYQRPASDRRTQLHLNPEQVEAARKEMEKGRELLGSIDKRGRLATHTVISRNLMTERRVSGGFQDVVDQKGKDDASKDSLLRSLSRYLSTQASQNSFQTPIRDILRESNVNAAVTIEPLSRQVPVYEEREKVTKGGFFRKDKIEMENVQTGTRDEPYTIGEFNGDCNDIELAYKIVYFVTGTKEKPYIDPTSRRHGGVFIGHIILPENVAKETFAEIEKDPALIKRILEKLDPVLMQEQQGHMPSVDEILVVPEGKARDALERDERNVAKGVNRKYVKTL